MGKILGVDVIINNVPGAGGRTGVIALNHAKPDGYTIGFLNIMGLVAYAQIAEVKDYDLKKFVYLAQISTDTWGIMVMPDSPLKSFEDLRTSKTPIRVGVTGAGSAGWANTILLSEVLGLPTHQITGYEGIKKVSLGLIRGDMDAAVLPWISHLEELKEGVYHPLVVTSAKRQELAPEAPTVVELGYPELVAATTIVRPAALPPGTPQDMAKILEAAMLKAMETDELKKWSVEVGRPMDPLPGAQVTKNLLAAMELFAKYKSAFAKYK